MRFGRAESDRMEPFAVGFDPVLLGTTDSGALLGLRSEL